MILKGLFIKYVRGRCKVFGPLVNVWVDLQNFFSLHKRCREFYCNEYGKLLKSTLGKKAPSKTTTYLLSTYIVHKEKVRSASNLSKPAISRLKVLTSSIYGPKKDKPALLALLSFPFPFLFPHFHQDFFQCLYL